MDLERVALEAVKVKIQEIFDEIIVTTAMEGKDIVIRISLPQEVMNKQEPPMIWAPGNILPTVHKLLDNSLDKEAQAAANELLGNESQP